MIAGLASQAAGLGNHQRLGRRFTTPLGVQRTFIFRPPSGRWLFSGKRLHGCTGRGIGDPQVGSRTRQALVSEMLLGHFYAGPDYVMCSCFSFPISVHSGRLQFGLRAVDLLELPSATAVGVIRPTPTIIVLLTLFTSCLAIASCTLHRPNLVGATQICFQVFHLLPARWRRPV